MDLDVAIEAEAEAQAICMQTSDFRRAFEAFAARSPPKFEGNWMDRSHLDWPFFDDVHRALAADLGAWAAASLTASDRADVDAACRALVRALGDAGWLRYCVPAAHGGALAAVDSRALCIARETLAYHDGLADFAFGDAGAGQRCDHARRQRCAEGALAAGGGAAKAIAAFALSEPEAGSDVGRMTPARAARRRRLGARRLQDVDLERRHRRLLLRVRAHGRGRRHTRHLRLDRARATAPGLRIAERIDVIAPHPLARLEFAGCRVAGDALLGDEGEGFKLAMRTLDIFRASVAAAALGFARRALDEALARSRERRMFGGMLADLQLTQASLGEMATAIDAAALLTYRAAWLRDVGGARRPRRRRWRK